MTGPLEQSTNQSLHEDIALMKHEILLVGHGLPSRSFLQIDCNYTSSFRVLPKAPYRPSKIRAYISDYILRLVSYESALGLDELTRSCDYTLRSSQSWRHMWDTL